MYPGNHRDWGLSMCWSEDKHSAFLLVYFSTSWNKSGMSKPELIKYKSGDANKWNLLLKQVGILMWFNLSEFWVLSDRGKTKLIVERGLLSSDILSQYPVWEICLCSLVSPGFQNIFYSLGICIRLLTFHMPLIPEEHSGKIYKKLLGRLPWWHSG